MMTTISSCLRRSRQTLRRWMLDPRFHRAAVLTGTGLGALLLSAASLSHSPQPFTLGLLLSLSGWQAAAGCLGGVAGYLLFWEGRGLQGVVWMLMGLGYALRSGNEDPDRNHRLLTPAMAGLIISVTGLAFQFWELDNIRLSLYLLRIAIAAGASWLFPAAKQREPFALWLTGGVAVLALSQTVPVLWGNPGYLLAGAMAVTGAFPAAAVAGLALDLARLTPVPMTAVLCLSWLLRLLPQPRESLLRLGPGLSHLLVCALTGQWLPLPAIALGIGGLLSRFLPEQPSLIPRRGETGVAQVRLEMAASVLAQSERLLLEVPEVPVDEEALLLRAVERACAGCPARKQCRDRDNMAAMSPQLLHRTLLSPQDLTASCRKGGRVLGELHRSQEQLRSIRAGRERQTEYRAALVQQYQFLSRYLQDLSDALSRREKEVPCVYGAQVLVYANREAGDNGDRCIWFPGTGADYFVVLCDGMGTGLGAIDEGRTAARLLQELLSAGFPPEHALASLNSLCALRDRAGACTVDLLQIRLDSGRCRLYKWGASPSYLLTEAGAEKIGTVGPPPGLSLETRETVSRLSLHRGETLLLLSDGVHGEDVPRRWRAGMEAGAGALAQKLLEQESNTDDATAVLIRLEPDAVSASYHNFRTKSVETQDVG